MGIEGQTCVFCGGKTYWSKSSTSFSGGSQLTEWTCVDCKSVRRLSDATETFHRSGHPLSYGPRAASAIEGFAQDAEERLDPEGESAGPKDDAQQVRP